MEIITTTRRNKFQKHYISALKQKNFVVVAKRGNVQIQVNTPPLHLSDIAENITLASPEKLMGSKLLVASLSLVRREDSSFLVDFDGELEVLERLLVVRLVAPSEKSNRATDGGTQPQPASFRALEGRSCVTPLRERERGEQRVPDMPALGRRRWCRRSATRDTSMVIGVVRFLFPFLL
jgi:hypothetical protein